MEAYQFHQLHQNQAQTYDHCIDSNILQRIKEIDFFFFFGSVEGEKTMFFPDVRLLVSDLYPKAHQLVILTVSSYIIAWYG